MSAKIFWSARSLVANRNFNHHFATLVWYDVCPRLPLPPVRQSDKFFVTLGAFPSNENPQDGDYGDLVFVGNAGGDVTAARTIISQTSGDGRGGNYAPQQNEVGSPSGNGQSFAQTLVRLAFHYERYSSRRPLEYDRVLRNSNTWANSLFRAAGVSENECRRLRNFRNWDVAEHREIGREYFGS